MREAVRHLVDELRAGDVHAVHDGVLLGAQDAVGLAARLEHVHLDVLLHHQPDLLQQGVQVLLHAPGTVHVQVEELRDLQQVGHLLRVCLVLEREGEALDEGDLWHTGKKKDTSRHTEAEKTRESETHQSTADTVFLFLS